MRRIFVMLAAVGLIATNVDIKGVAAGDRAYSDDTGVKRAGNWSRADQEAAKSASKKTRGSEIPVPRPKPGSKAAKADAARAKADTARAKAEVAKPKKVAKSEAKKAPVPRKKTLPKKSAEAGIVASENDSGNTSAPYRGSLESDEIKDLLNGKVLTSRIDGKRANVTLAEGGILNWRSSAGEGRGRWWTEKGRICDRYDPSGDFPGRGAGCRSFEQKADGYYAGGRKLKFVN
jgi:hypothetical protein